MKIFLVVSIVAIATTLSACETDHRQDYCKEVLSKPTPPEFDCLRHMAEQDAKCQQELSTGHKFEDGSSTRACRLESCESGFERSARGQWGNCMDWKKLYEWKW